MPDVILVGESNPYEDNPTLALHDSPKNSAGWRLRRILGLPRVEYARLARTNLCRGAWDLQSARRAAEGVLIDARTIFLLGRRVADAFRFRGGFFSAEVVPGGGPMMVSLPHPSGRCREWNARGAVGTARRVFTRWANLPERLHVCPDEFGRDHHSTLLYVETCCVDGSGRLDRRRLRHDGFTYPTRLADGFEAYGHDDADCLWNMEQAGLLRLLGDGVSVRLTDAGWDLAHRLRRERGSRNQ